MGDLDLDREDVFPPLSKERLQSLPRRKYMSSAVFSLENVSVQEECFLTVQLLMQHNPPLMRDFFIHLEVA